MVAQHFLIGPYNIWQTPAQKRNNMKSEKKFEIPELVIIEFPKEDVILTSVVLGEWWEDAPVEQ